MQTVPTIRRTSASLFMWPCALVITSAAWADCPPFPNWTELTYDRPTRALAAGDDRLWVGTYYGGVIEWDVIHDTFRKYTRLTDGLPDNQIQDIAVDPVRGDVWVATWRGAARLPAGSPGPWIVYTPDNSGIPATLTTAVRADSAGTVWIGTYDAGLVRFDGETWTQHHTGNSGLSDDLVTSIGVGLDGAIWVGVWGDGIDRFDGVTWTNYNPGNTNTPETLALGCDAMMVPSDELGLISSFIYIKAIDPVTGNLWVRNEDDSFCPNGGFNGLSRFDGTSWNTFTELNSGLSSGFVDAVLIDDDGVAWVGSPAGLQQFDGRDWQSVAPISATCATNVDGGLWFGRFDGLIEYEDGDFLALNTGQLADSSVGAVALEPDGEVWFGTRLGLHRFDGETWERFDTLNSGLTNSDVRALARDSQGALWVGTWGGAGVHRYQGGVWTAFPSGQCCHNVSSIAVAADGDVWVGSWFGGLSRYQNGTWTTFSAGAGLPSVVIWDIATGGNGEVWVGTPQGAARWNGFSWTHFNTASGLPHNNVRAVGVAPNGDVWFATNGGVARWTGDEWTTWPLGVTEFRDLGFDADGNVWVAKWGGGVARYDGVAWESFGFDDGLTNDRVNAIAVEPSGSVWFGTDIGAARFDPDAVTGPRGDLTGDGAVDLADLGKLLAAFGVGAGGDLDGDGDTDLSDLGIVLSNFGASCP